MRFQKKYLLKPVWILLLLLFGCLRVEPDSPTAASTAIPYGPAQFVGRVDDELLVECSGMDISMATADLIWAINDGGHGPYLHALNGKGRSIGRVLVKGAKNRDWEGLDTFIWNGRPMILIADFGDNFQVHARHTLYVVDEPVLTGKIGDELAAAAVAWRINYSYPATGHDAEAVAVDTGAGKVLILTKRDTPPVLFEVPLLPPGTDRPIVASKIATLDHLTPPGNGSLLAKYGNQPTALDVTADGSRAVVLTYTDAHLFNRNLPDSWAQVFSGPSALIPLPHPQERMDFRQREAIFFGPDQKTLFVTSEGKGAGIFRMDAN
jgi:hypothetical protein